MEKHGIIRRIDDLGRIVIPREIRRDMGISEGDALEIMRTDEGVLVRPYPKANGMRSYALNLKDAIRDTDWLKDEDREQLIGMVRELESMMTAIESRGEHRP